MLTPNEVRKSSAGRRPIDAIVLFRMLNLQALNNLSEEQVEYHVMIGYRSRDFCGWLSRAAFRTPPRSGRPNSSSLKSYSTASTQHSLPKAGVCRC